MFRLFFGEISENLALWEMYMLPQFDLSRVTSRLEKQGHVKEDLDVAVQEYRKFIFLCSQGANICAPPKVDDVWHAHMLDSVHYFSDCEKYFGFYLHHDPCENGVDEGDMNSTLAFYEEVFGEKPNEVWMELATCAGPGKGCGSITMEKKGKFPPCKWAGNSM